MKKSGLSLMEVLVATCVIAVAVYGMIITLGAQELAELRMREERIVKQLHVQLVGEILRGERLPLGGSIILWNPALGSTATAVTYSDVLDTANTTLSSSLVWKGSASANKTSLINALYMGTSNQP